MANIVGAPYLSESHPVSIRPNGAIQIAELARMPISAVVSPNSSAIGPVNGAKENHIRNEKLNPIVASSSVRYFVILIRPMLTPPRRRTPVRFRHYPVVFHELYAPLALRLSTLFPNIQMKQGVIILIVYKN